MKNLALVSPKSPILFAPSKPSEIINRLRSHSILTLPARRRGGIGCARRHGSVVCAFWRRSSSSGSQNGATIPEKLEMQGSANISSSSRNEMFTSSGSEQFPVLPPPSNIGSPLFWIMIGVGLSALFSTVATKLKAYAMQQAFKSMMSQTPPQNGQFNAGFSADSSFPFQAASASSGFSADSPFPFQAASTSSRITSSPTPRPVASERVVTVDVSATEVVATSPTDIGDKTAIKEPKKYAFVDVSQEEVLKNDSEYSNGSIETNPRENIHSDKEVLPNEAAFKQDRSASNEQSQPRRPTSGLSVEALEKMMEDPTVQKMVYPYLPEEMRNPTTFKWMLQNPEYRRQLEDMLSNMGGSNEWDSRMVESFKSFDLSSPEVKQKFEQIGLTPEEVISKIMENPEVAVAFQNPKVQAAIMDLSQNPYSIAKYQNDKEVMDVFAKISELFPGASGGL